MLRKLQVVMVLFCTLSYASAETIPIGTASARGDMRVDHYAVKGNATLFNGSVVETGQATADLRLDRGTEITVAKDSLCTIHRDRLLLERGQTEFSSNSYQLRASGLRVIPAEPNSRGVVSMKQGNTVEVAALTGSFTVTNNAGVPLASIHPGPALSFAVQASGENSKCVAGKNFSARGIVSCENKHYYVVTDIDPGTGAETRYELTGKDLKAYVGKKVDVSGTLKCDAIVPGGPLGVLSVTSAAVVGGGGIGTTALILTGVGVAAGTGTAVGLVVANQSSSPASR